MEYLLHLLVMVGIFGAIASAANMDAGFGGVLSFGYAAVFGAGAYVTACLLGAQSAPIWLALTGAIAVGIGANLVVAAIAGRLADGDFAVATLAAHGLFAAVVLNTSFVGGPMGLQIGDLQIGGLSLSAPKVAAAIALSLLALSIMLALSVQRSSLGRALRVVREDPVLALSLGIDERACRIRAMAMSGALVGAAGFVFAAYVQFVHPDSFTTREAILIVCMVIAGGLGAPWGALAGASMLVLLPESLRWIGLPPASEGPMRDILYGSLLATLVLLRPLGLLGSFVPGAKPSDATLK
jgi:branched-chain amino acid transport system permease protein